MTADRWCSCCLVAVLILLLCVTPISCEEEYDQPSPITPPPPVRDVQVDNARTFGKTTLLNSSGASSEVITTLRQGEKLEVLCRKEADYVFDDPWWLNVYVPSLFIQGWVADYYCDCGHIGNCIAPLC